MKNIVIISDSFKGTLSSLDICHLFKDELKDRKDIKPIYIPIADGGEGSLLSVSFIIPGKFIEVEVKDLYFNKIKTKFYIDNGNNAYIESASCVGLNLAHQDNDPGLVTTYGIGEQIKKAIELGIKRIYVFLGGSASNDGGAGLASALGTTFYDKNNKPFIPTGLTLKDIDHFDICTFPNDIEIIALSDVKSPLFGPNGAAYTFAKQKGASEEEIVLLDDGLKHLSDLINKYLNKDIANIPGSGAAGGLGGGLAAFTNAKIESGIDTFLDLVNFDERIKNADLVISGEGKLDKQTFEGKVVDGVASRCLKNHKPLSLIVGVSEIPIEEVKRRYPCVINLYETNPEHLPFEKIKNSAKEDYRKVIKILDL